jgi:hypothetical protein
MSRRLQMSLGVGLSLSFDGILWWVFYRQARIKDGDPSVLWWLLTISLAIVALVPLFEMARRGRLLERVLAGILSCIPFGWLVLCFCAAFN